MTRYLVKRVAWAAVLLLVITLVTYVIFFVIPSGTTQAAGRLQSTQETTTLRNATGIHGSFIEEYWQFLTHVGRGSLGHSFANRRDVTEILARAAPITASLVFGGAFIWLVVAIPVGLMSALRPRSLGDRAGMLFVLIGVSAHPAWIGLILAWLLSNRLHVFPLSGYCDLFRPAVDEACGGPVQWAYHLILPWITFGLLFAAIYARMIRATIAETMHEDYVLTARAKGASEWRVLRKHVLRNAMLPIVTMLGMDLGVAMGNAVFVESVYGLPGIGKTVFSASTHKDLPVVVGVVVFVTTAIVVFNLVADLVYGLIDPRIKLVEGGAEVQEKEERLARRAGSAVSEPA